MSDALKGKLDALPLSIAYPCNYLPERAARQQHIYWPAADGHVPGEFYQRLMDARFRRSGRLFYRPSCDGCDACVPIRIVVADYVPSESQKRALKKNQDLTLSWAVPKMDRERVALYTRYTALRHHAGEKHANAEAGADELAQFLYDSPTDTIEAVYRLDGHIIAVGICDLTPDALSSVYFYFDPRQSKRSLGVLSAVQEIAYACASGRDYYYLGYWIEGCRKMDYKAALADHELLVEGRWQKTARRRI